MCVNEYVRETVPVATDAAVVSVSSVTPPTLKISAVIETLLESGAI